MRDRQPRVSDATRETLRRLAEVEPAESRVLSVYVNLDPATFGTAPARASQITSLMHEAEDLAARERLGRAERELLAEDVERVRAVLSGGLPVDGASTIAVFACSAAELFEIVRIYESVQQRVEVGSLPCVDPLVDHLHDERWCVALVSKRAARFFRGSHDRIREADRVEDVVHGRHGQGGWSQARYERSVGEDVVRHLAHVNETLQRMLDRSPFEHLLIGSPDDFAPHVEESLHPALRERIAGRVTLDVDNVTVDDVLAAVREAIERYEGAEERALLDRLDEGLGTATKAAAGIEDVYQALVEKRVGTLMLDPRDRWNEAVRLAVAQSADVRVIHVDGALTPHGGIAALLRF